MGLLQFWMIIELTVKIGSVGLTANDRSISRKMDIGSTLIIIIDIVGFLLVLVFGIKSVQGSEE